MVFAKLVNVDKSAQIRRGAARKYAIRNVVKQNNINNGMSGLVNSNYGHRWHPMIYWKSIVILESIAGLSIWFNMMND